MWKNCYTNGKHYTVTQRWGWQDGGYTEENTQLLHLRKKTVTMTENTACLLRGGNHGRGYTEENTQLLHFGRTVTLKNKH